jgi:hypothetical protein
MFALHKGHEIDVVIDVDDQDPLPGIPRLVRMVQEIK